MNLKEFVIVTEIVNVLNNKEKEINILLKNGKEQLLKGAPNKELEMRLLVAIVQHNLLKDIIREVGNILD